MSAAKSTKSDREKRLAEQLRVNLRRRKVQSKERKIDTSAEKPKAQVDAASKSTDS